MQELPLRPKRPYKPRPPHRPIEEDIRGYRNVGQLNQKRTFETRQYKDSSYSKYWYEPLNRQEKDFLIETLQDDSKFIVVGENRLIVQEIDNTDFATSRWEKHLSKYNEKQLKYKNKMKEWKIKEKEYQLELREWQDECNRIRIINLEEELAELKAKNQAN